MNQILTIPDAPPVRRGWLPQHVRSLLQALMSRFGSARFGGDVYAPSLPDDLKRDVGLEGDGPRRGGGALSALWPEGREVRRLRRLL
jgi:hypothetical protein